MIAEQAVWALAAIGFSWCATWARHRINSQVNAYERSAAAEERIAAAIEDASICP